MKQQHASKITVGLLTAVILFHLCVITQIIPYSIVWAGKLKTTEEMLVFETISIFVNLLLITLLLLKSNYRQRGISNKIVDGFLWFFVFVFGLNTIGNLMAESLFEKIVFTPLTLIFAILIGIVVKSPKKLPIATKTIK